MPKKAEQPHKLNKTSRIIDPLAEDVITEETTDEEVVQEVFQIGSGPPSSPPLRSASPSSSLSSSFDGLRLGRCLRCSFMQILLMLILGISVSVGIMTLVWSLVDKELEENQRCNLQGIVNTAFTAPITAAFTWIVKNRYDAGRNKKNEEGSRDEGRDSRTTKQVVAHSVSGMHTVA